MISVIVLVHNTEKYLPRCLDSLISQTYQDFEVIVVDDASEGNVKDIISRYSKKDRRIRIISNEVNQGIYWSRMVGVEKARGEYLAFVDSDDSVGVDFLRLLMVKATEDNLDIVAGSIVRVNPEGVKQVLPLQLAEFGCLPLTGSEISESFLRQQGSCYAWQVVCNKLYKRTLWNFCHPYFLQMRRHVNMTEDLAFSLVLMLCAKSMDIQFNAVYYYYENESSMTVIPESSLDKNIQDVFEVLQFGQDVISQMNFTGDYLENWQRFQEYYIGIWQDIAAKNGFKLEEKYSKYICAETLKRINRLDRQSEVLYYLERIRFSNALEEIKRRIMDSAEDSLYIELIGTAVLAIPDKNSGPGVWWSRGTTREIFDTARLCHKKVYFISDSNLKRASIEVMLHSCGYEDYEGIVIKSELTSDCTECLFSGPYRLALGNALNLGGRISLNKIEYPSPTEVYADRLGEEVEDTSVALFAVASYFDNPFRPFAKRGTKGIDPWFVGYGYLGSFLLGAAAYLYEEVIRRGKNRLLFVGKSGKLIRKAFDLYASVKRTNLRSECRAEDIRSGAIQGQENSLLYVNMTEKKTVSNRLDTVFLHDRDAVRLDYLLECLCDEPIADSEGNYASTLVLKQVQEGALHMVQDYLKSYYSLTNCLPVITREAMDTIYKFFIQATESDKAFFRYAKIKDIRPGSMGMIPMTELWKRYTLYIPFENVRVERNAHSTSELRPAKSDKEYDDEITLIRNHLTGGEQHRLIAWFGCGRICKALMEEEKCQDLPLDLLLDNDITKAGGDLMGKKIVHPNQINHWGEYYVILTCSGETELAIEHQLLGYGLEKGKDYIRWQELIEWG